MSPSPHDTGVVELFGALAYGELTAFARLADDSELASSTQARAELGRLAAREFSHYELLERRLRELGVDPHDAMAPFVDAVDDYHRRTTPHGWAERLVKAYVGDGFATDFYREVGTRLGDADRALVEEVLRSEGKAELVETELRTVLEAEPTLAGRLSLWGRRLMGEAMSQAQQVAARHPELVQQVVGEGDLAELGLMFARLADAHAERMAHLGLTA